MPTAQNGSLSEQISLLERDGFDAAWKHRLALDDPVMQLGETFILNSHVTPIDSGVSSLIPKQALQAVGSWLRQSTCDVPTMYRDVVDTAEHDGASDAWPDGAIYSLERLGRAVGLDFDAIPGSYSSWRLVTEIYVLWGRTLYRLSDHYAVRYKVLSETELAIAASSRLLPLFGDFDTMDGPMAFLVGLPVRGASLGGLRGYRSALIAAGSGLADLGRASEGDPSRSWIWETEFYDDAACRLLSVDGVERFPVAIGTRIAREETTDDRDCRSV